MSILGLKDVIESDSRLEYLGGGGAYDRQADASKTWVRFRLVGVPDALSELRATHPDLDITKSYPTTASGKITEADEFYLVAKDDDYVESVPSFTGRLRAALSFR